MPFDGVAVWPGPVFSGGRARLSGLATRPGRVVVEVPGETVYLPEDAGPLPELLPHWVPYVDDYEGWHCGPILAGARLTRGYDSLAVADGAGGFNLTVGGRFLISSAGNVYRFSSSGAAQKWAEITRARVANELRRNLSLTGAARVKWLDKKRAQMEKQAAQRVNAAARLPEGQIKSAVLADAGFALAKWAGV